MFSDSARRGYRAAFKRVEYRDGGAVRVLDALINANFPQINKLALDARLPTIYGLRDFLGFGGLMSYGAKPSEMFRRAGDYVDKILKGAKPADLPVEQPTKFELVVNLTTAKALGLNIPDPFLLRIDETIE